jgi:AraC-like DNA-binding protein
MEKKKEGFTGQRAIVLPLKAVEKINQTLVNNLLYPTALGYYPKAEFHYRQRKNGAQQHILIYCIAGEGWCKIKNREFVLQANEFLVIPQGTPHAYGSNEKNPWTIYWIHFKGSTSDPMAEALFQKVLIQSNKITFNDQRIKLFDSIYDNLEQGYGKHTAGYASILLWHFLGSFLYDDRFSYSPEQENKNITEKAIEYMHNHIKERIILKQLCSYLGISLSHFSLLFKQKTGYAPIEYCIYLKIQKACQLLQFSSLRINEIAVEIGINDPYYFSRLFTDTMGVSPKKYRKNLSNGK